MDCSNHAAAALKDDLRAEGGKSLLGILLLLLWLLAKRTPKTKTRVLSLIYAAFIYSSVVVFFDHQLGVSWNLGNLLLPFFDLTAGLIAG